MKITRLQLRKLIIESMLNEDSKFLGFDEVADNPEALKFKSAPGGPLEDLQKKMKEKVGANISLDKYYLAKEFYETYTSKGVPGLLGMTGKSLGISGKGDPYTYKSMGNGKYKVISGPDPKAIGKVFTPKKKQGEDKNNAVAGMTFEPFLSYGDQNEMMRLLKEKGINMKKLQRPSGWGSMPTIIKQKSGVDVLIDTARLKELAEGMNIWDVADSLYAEISADYPHVLGIVANENEMNVAIEIDGYVYSPVIPARDFGVQSFDMSKANKALPSLSDGPIDVSDAIFVKAVSESYRRRYRRY